MLGSKETQLLVSLVTTLSAKLDPSQLVSATTINSSIICYRQNFYVPLNFGNLLYSMLFQRTFWPALLHECPKFNILFAKFPELSSYVLEILLIVRCGIPLRIRRAQHFLIRYPQSVRTLLCLVKFSLIVLPSCP